MKLHLLPKSQYCLISAVVTMLLALMFFICPVHAEEHNVSEDDILQEEELLLLITPILSEEEYTVQIEDCRIIDQQQVLVRVSSEYLTYGDDHLYHLIARQPWESETEGTVVAAARAQDSTSFVFDLNKQSVESVLNCSFVAAIRVENDLIPVSGPAVITNPEAAAAKTKERLETGKKGLLPEASILRSGDLERLHIQQCLYNVPLGNFLKGTGFRYRYHGKDYEFSEEVVHQYDLVVSYLYRQGIQVTFVILNNLTTDYGMLHPLSRNGWGRYYAFNTAEEEGEQKTEALISLLAERYSGNGRGTVDNWIIGNEINARTDWHYMYSGSVRQQAEEYEKAFRIFYNIIKSTNANANVYISIDQQWTWTNSSGSYSSRSFLDAFNECVRERGNIDWRVAMHPYNYPMTAVRAWAENARNTHDFDTPNISIQNIDVLTDYLMQDEFLSPSGDVRTVLCSEVGYTAMGGEQLQTAAIVYAYVQVMNNQYIDGLILSREMDDPSEMVMGLYYGLIDVNLKGRLSHAFYMHLGTEDEGTYISAAEEIIGVEDIMELITVR